MDFPFLCFDCRFKWGEKYFLFEMSCKVFFFCANRLVSTGIDGRFPVQIQSDGSSPPSCHHSSIIGLVGQCNLVHKFPVWHQYRLNNMCKLIPPAVKQCTGLVSALSQLVKIYKLDNGQMGETVSVDWFSQQLNMTLKADNGIV